MIFVWSFLLDSQNSDSSHLTSFDYEVRIKERFFLRHFLAGGFAYEVLFASSQSNNLSS